jgi:hypothetical protein
MATHEDAMIIVEIAKWGAMSNVDEALSVVFGDDFNPETADAGAQGVRTLLSFGELVGTFVKNNVLDRDLANDMWAAEMLWKRVGPAARRAREQFGEPRLYENFEAWARQPAAAGV